MRVLDDNSRRSPRRLANVEEKNIEFHGRRYSRRRRVRKPRREDEVHYLVFVNGTEFFYSQPHLVLDVGVRAWSMLSTLPQARHRDAAARPSSEVYQTPPKFPPDESAPLLIPDPLNPRYPYGGGEADQRAGGDQFRPQIFRARADLSPTPPLRPRLGLEHVIPQFALRLDAAAKHRPSYIAFQNQVAEQRRVVSVLSTTYPGVMTMREKGEHLDIYHVGTTEEVTIAKPARRIASIAGRENKLVAGKPAPGGTARRCPDISKLAGLGYRTARSAQRGPQTRRLQVPVHAEFAPKA